MKKNLLSFFLLTIFICFYSCYQKSLIGADNSFSVNNYDNAIKTYKKIYNKYRHDVPIPRQIGYISFQVAECYRLVNDTNQCGWYKKSIHDNKQAFTSCKCSKIDKFNFLKRIAYSYYYLGDFENAQLFFKKSFMFNLKESLEPQLFKYYINCLDTLGQDSLIEIKTNEQIDRIKNYYATDSIK
jgi:tetratricopeptide (TPR) repeat protein